MMALVANIEVYKFYTVEDIACCMRLWHIEPDRRDDSFIEGKVF